MKTPESIRLKKIEQKEIEEKCKEINKILIQNNKKPIQESELIHKILEICIKRTELNKELEIQIK